MVPFHIEDAGGALAVAFQRQAPGGMADARRIFGARRRRLGRHEPAGIGGAGEDALGLAEQQAHDAVLAGAERQTPTCGQIEETRVSPDLGQHRRKTATAKTFLKHPEGVCGLGDADDDQAARVEAEAGDTGAIGKSGLVRGGGFDDPQNRAIILHGEAGKNGNGEAGHGGGIAAFRTSHLVESGTAKAAGKNAIETGDGEGEKGAGAAR